MPVCTAVPNTANRMLATIDIIINAGIAAIDSFTKKITIEINGIFTSMILTLVVSVLSILNSTFIVLALLVLPNNRSAALV